MFWFNETRRVEAGGGGGRAVVVAVKGMYQDGRDH